MRSEGMRSEECKEGLILVSQYRESKVFRGWGSAYVHACRIRSENNLLLPLIPCNKY